MKVLPVADEKVSEEELRKDNVLDVVISLPCVCEIIKSDAEDKTSIRSPRAAEALDFRTLGFLMNYFTVGIILGGLPSTVYGLFLGYLHVPAYVYATATAVTTLPWSVKFIFGLINDCCPIYGLKRKPYMALGWTICCGTLVVMSQRSMVAPYYCLASDGAYLTSEPPCNVEAAKSGGEYAMLMCLAALGYVISDVAADGLLVTYAQKEPIERRGSMQTTAYIVRSLGSVVAVCLVGLCMNGKKYEGTFEWTLEFNQICGVLAIPAGIMIPISLFVVTEERGIERAHLRDYLKDIWQLLTKKAFFYVVMYQFWGPFIYNISTPASGLVKSEWAGVKALQQQLFSMISLIAFSWGLWQVQRRFLHSSWRGMLLMTTLVLTFLDAACSFLTIYKVVRSQYFYLGETVLSQIPAAANFVVASFVVVEMAEKGNEGLVFGLLTTCSNLSGPLSQVVGNMIFGFFRPNLSDSTNYQEDTTSFRNVVALSFAIGYAFSFLSLLFLPFLPDQKAEAQERKSKWPTHRAYGVATVGLIVIALCYSVTIAFLTMLPDLACLSILGGPGC